MQTRTIISGQTSNTNVELLDDETLQVLGNLNIQNGQPAVIAQGDNTKVQINQGGAIQSDNTAIQVNGSETLVFNNGLIEGSFNGVNLANDDVASASIFNNGTIRSASRAVNLGRVFGTLTNTGLITTTANPRNGTVYSDVTNNSFTIENRGLIDVGQGLSGDAISVELGANVTGSIVNQGKIQGRGVALGQNQSAAVRYYHSNDPTSETSVFTGNLANYGALTTENGATVIIEDNVEFRGGIQNYGLIEGGKVDYISTNLDQILGRVGVSQLAIDARETEGNISILNNGDIRGGVLLGNGTNSYNARRSGSNNWVRGGDGVDVILDKVFLVHIGQ